MKYAPQGKKSPQKNPKAKEFNCFARPLYCTAFILTFIIQASAFAQVDYRPGYVIKNNGRMETGLINFRGDESNESECFFKKDSLSEPIKYATADLMGYRFTDSKYYVRKKIVRYNVEEVLFLECLISGRSTIYSSNEQDTARFFIEKDGAISEIYSTDVVGFDLNGYKSGSKSNHNKGILKYYFKDCPELYQRIDNTTFDKKSLIKISKDYHEKVCKDEKCIIYEKSFAKNELDIGIDFSYGPVHYKYYYGNFNNAGGSYSGKNLFLFNQTANQFQVNLSAQTNLGENKWYFLKFSVGYYACKIKQDNLPIGFVYVIPYDMRSDSFNIAYSFAVLKSSLSLKRKFILGKLNPYLSIGVPVGIYIKDDGNAVQSNVNNPYQASFGKSGFYENEFKHEGLLFGGSFETGIEIPHLLTSKGIFLSLLYERLQTTSTIKGNSFGFKTGFYF